MDRYEEALERAKKGLPIDEVFPELKESEDERIRKELIDFVNHYRHNTDLTTEQAEWCKMAIAYLEKQKEQEPIFRVGDYVRNIKTGDKVLIEQLDIATKIYCYVSKDGVAEIHSDFPFSKQNEWEVIGQQVEQKPESCDCSRDEESYTNGIHHVLMNPEAYGLIKQQPAEWSEEDDNALVLFHELISFGYTERFCDAQTAEDMRRWLNERLKSTRPQPKQEWSEEFLRLMGITISQDGNQVCVLLGENLAEGIAGFGDTLADAVEEFKKEWRQFDRFRKATWKPSEEQMKWLKDVIETVPMTCRQQVPLESLYNDLKKLL